MELGPEGGARGGEEGVGGSYFRNHTVPPALKGHQPLGPFATRDSGEFVPARQVRSRAPGLRAASTVAAPEPRLQRAPHGRAGSGRAPGAAEGRGVEGGGGRGRGRGSPRPTEGRAVGGASGPRGSSGESRGVKGRDLPAPSSRPAAPRVALIRPTARAHVSARARMSPRGAPRGAKAGRGRLRLVGASALNTNKPFSTALPPSPPGTPTWKGLAPPRRSHSCRGRSTVSVGLAEKWDSQVLPFKKTSNDCNDNVCSRFQFTREKWRAEGCLKPGKVSQKASL